MNQPPPGPLPTGDPIDRIAPTLRPAGRVAMYQRWEHLLFLHWPVPSESIARMLPPGLEVDTFGGRAYVGLVPFTMRGVRPRGLPAVRWLSDFHEVNVRTYVHAGGRDPGVWFFSLDAESRIAVRLARLWYHLPYSFAAMHLGVGSTAADGHGPEIEYRSERKGPGPRPASCRLTYRPAGEPDPARPGTLEHFLIERYILYAQARGSLYSGRVHHDPYPVQAAELLDLQEDLVAAAGVEPTGGAPLVHYARGVRVEVFPLERAGEGFQIRSNLKT